MRAQMSLAPTGRPHWAASEREGRERGHELAQTGRDRLSWAAGAGGGGGGGAANWAGLGQNEVFYFSGISNAFSILFSLGFLIQIQTNSNMCNNSKNILSST
jgi:hypothetical protein